MIIAEAILTFVIAIFFLGISSLWAAMGVSDREPWDTLLGVACGLFSVLVIVFQGVALGGHLIIAEAVFTFILSTVIVAGGASLALDREARVIGIGIILFALVTIVFQGTVLAG